MIPPCSCNPPAPPTVPFCPFCRGATGGASMSQFVQGGPGIQVGGDASGMVAGGDIHYTAAHDGYTAMEMGRERSVRAWLPDNWLAAASAAVGVLGFFVNSKLNLPAVTPWLFLASLALVMAGLGVFLLREKLSKTGCIPFWGWVIEQGEDGRAYLSLATGTCPRCQRKMQLRRVKNGNSAVYLWVCDSGVTMHNLLFDPTEFHKS